MQAVRAINPETGHITTMSVLPSRELAEARMEYFRSSSAYNPEMEFDVLDIVPGTECTVSIVGTLCEGTVQRVSDHSVWIKVAHYSGTFPTHRYIVRKDGTLVMAGSRWGSVRFDR